MKIRINVDLNVPRWVQNTILGLVASAALLGVGLGVKAWAAPITVASFAQNETLTSKKLNDQLTLLQDAVNQSSPTGTIVAFFGNAAPAGWLVADGTGISKQTNPEYAALVDHLRNLSTTYQGATTNDAFLPDLRGLFLRGKNITRNDAYANPGGDEAIGTPESDTFQLHTHSATVSTAGSHVHTGVTSTTGSHVHAPASGTMFMESSGTIAFPNTGAFAYSAHSTTAAAGDHSHSVSLDPAGSHDHVVNNANTGSAETRPKSVTVLFVIKL